MTDGLDFSPRPGAASLPKMITAQFRMELRLLLRNGEQLGVTLVIPLLLLVVGSLSPWLFDATGKPIDTLAPGVIALAIMSASFTSLAIATGFERRYGVLKRLGASPLPRGGLLAGKIGAVLAVEVIQLIVIFAVAFGLGWNPKGGIAALLWVLVFALFGTAAFGSLALLIAGTLRAEATLAVANLVYVLLLIGGAVLIPLSTYPKAIAPLLNTLPSTALGEGLRAALLGETPTLVALAVLLAWAFGAGIAAAKTFNWE